MNDRLHPTLARRAQHSSRSAAVIIALSIVLLVAAYLGTEAVLALIGAAPLLLSPADLAAGAATASPITIGVGIGAIVLGFVAVLAALLPGRRARHRLTDDRTVLIVDDNVLAGAISGRAAAEARISIAQVQTSVTRRRATVSVRPDSGFPVDAAAIDAAATSVVTDLGPRPRPRVSVRTGREGALA